MGFFQVRSGFQSRFACLGEVGSQTKELVNRGGSLGLCVQPFAVV